MEQIIDHYKLYETQPAETFDDAHLLGNGSLGASVYGGIPYEKILINHDTLWSGQENAKISEDTFQNFAQARELTLQGDVKQATTLINDKMLGYWSETFLPLGHLHLTIGHTSDRRTMVSKRILENDYPTEHYSRTLTLSNALERIKYDQRERHYTREMFVSKPDDVLVVRLAASGGSLDFSLAMDSPLRHEQLLSEKGAAVLGRAPDRVEPYGPRYAPNVVYHPDDDSNSLRFATAAEVVKTDGTVHKDKLRVYVSGASYAVIVLAADTNFKGAGVARDNSAQKILSSCRARVHAAGQKGYDALLHAHTQDYSALYGRVSIQLGAPLTDTLPTTQRMQAAQNIDDPAFSALVMQYTRYLLISFSRPGTQAGNLQGIWNPSLTPSWACNYTTNINVQMNYWGAETFALPECHAPMMELVRGCAKTGETAARALYNMPGWVTHHNTDLWRFAALAGEDASWAWWPFGGFWMCQHLWQHYEFTRDTDFLEQTVYPVLKGATEFLCAFVVKDETGVYVTAPSTSPENKFFINEAGMWDFPEEVRGSNRFSPNRTDTAEICKAATLDVAITRELLGNFQHCLTALGRTDPLATRAQEVLDALMPFQIGEHGQLQEWEKDYKECTPGMSHLSHLYPVYPGDLLSAETTPDLHEAARKALCRRAQHGCEPMGWPGAWQLCLRARFGEGELANQLTRTLPQNMGGNLLTQGCSQIDAVMGWGAGLGEMLLQSQGGKLRLLPALPSSWQTGAVCGLRARGGLTVDIHWQGGRLSTAQIKGTPGEQFQIVYASITAAHTLPATGCMLLNENLVPQSAKLPCLQD